MEHSDKKFWELAEKLLNGTITPAEEKELADWYNTRQDEPVNIPSSFATNEQELESRMLYYVQQHRQQPEPAVVRRLWPRVAVAAVILLCITTAAYWWLKPAPQPVAIAPQKEAQDIQPGSDKAVLTMPDGSRIVLDDVQNGTLRSQQHLQVVKQDSGQLAYKTSGNVSNAEIAWHTLSVPRGGQYQLVLSDGTKVWLNAASGIRFPTAFTGHERQVEIYGEAYFEVAKNAAMPFHVKVNKQTTLGDPATGDAEITVLGTHFNINAYMDEAAVNTTLLEGSVRVARPLTQSNVILKPGQQAAVVSGNATPIQVQTVDTDDVVAWKEGLFRFRKMNIESVMRQVARWYNVEVAYEGHPVNQHFNGVIARHVPVSEVVKMLELTRTMHFDIEGNKIVVKAGAR